MVAVAVVAIWIITGGACLFAIEYLGPPPENPVEWTIGHVLLFMLFGPIFLPLVLGSYLCQLKVHFPHRRMPSRSEFVEEAEREVDGWMRPW